MKKYYLHNGTEQQGPFDIEDLKAKNINKDTSIWYEGLSDWTTAGQIDELKDLLKTSTPPPFGAKQTTPPPISKPKVEQATTTTPTKTKSKFSIWRLLQILAGLFLAGLLVMFLISKFSNNGGSGSGSGSGSYQEKVMTVEEIEKSDPARFLDASGTYNQNFWGNKLKVHGTVKNNATVANHKDVIVEVRFLSGTETELSRQRYVIYDYFPAHSSKEFELSIERPSGCEKLGWDAVSATPY